MKFLPIVGRELRVASRRQRTYWGRCAAGGIAVLVFLYLVMVMGGRFGLGGFLGPVLFNALGVMSLAYCLLAGVGTTSDCLAEEKREGTLGLLFLTDLKGFDVVLGKMVASSIGAFYFLIAVLPILTVPLLLGGVSSLEILRLAVLLLNTLLFSLSIGVGASALCRDDRRAMALTLLVIAGIAGGFPLLAGWVMDAFPGAKHWEVLLLPSPGYAYSELNSRTDDFWCSIATTVGISVLSVAFACWWLPRSWQEKGRSARSDRLGQKLEGAAFGPADKRSAWRAAMLDRNPFLWLCARKRIGPALVWGALALGGAIWLIGAWRSPRDFWEESSYVTTAFVSHLLLKLWFATEACRRFADDRRSGALELLLSTPLQPQEILRGQFQALRRMFLGPALALLVVDCLMIVDIMADQPGRHSTLDQELFLITTFACGMTVFAMDLKTMAWLGPWLALNGRSGAKAASGVALRVLLLPWVAYLASLFLMIPLLANSGVDEYFVLFLWLGICLGIDFFWLQWARTRLQTSFREIATTRFDAAKAGWFAKMFSNKPD